jgi:hypothetical protein
VHRVRASFVQQFGLSSGTCAQHSSAERSSPRAPRNFTYGGASSSCAYVSARPWRDGTARPSQTSSHRSPPWCGRIARATRPGSTHPVLPPRSGGRRRGLRGTAHRRRTRSCGAAILARSWARCDGGQSCRGTGKVIRTILPLAKPTRPPQRPHRRGQIAGRGKNGRAISARSWPVRRHTRVVRARAQRTRHGSRRARG